MPLEATLVVNRRTIDSLGWLNSYQGLTVPFLATAFGTFLIRQVFLTLPKDLRDAAPSTASATSASCATSPCRWCARRSARWPRWRSWQLEPVPVAEPDHDEDDMYTVQSGLQLARARRASTSPTW